MKKAIFRFFERILLKPVPMMIYDFITIYLSYFLALFIRFEFKIEAIQPKYIAAFNKSIFVYGIFCIAFYVVNKMYKSIWKFASLNELFRSIISVCFCVLSYILASVLLAARMPYSYFVIGFILQLIFACLIRFLMRFYLFIKSPVNRNEKARRIMVIGAGDAGQQIIRDININVNGEKQVVCVIDDDKEKHGKYIDGVEVVGGRDDILVNVEKYEVDEIFFAIPAASMSSRSDILNICKETSCEIKVLPGLFQLANGDVSVSQMKKVAIEDLLGRDVIQVNNDEIFDFINNRVVMVTGGGGSIGSELCRQIAKNNPKQLIIFDVYENNAYDIEQELKRKYPELNLLVLIGSVRDSKRVDSVLDKHRPEIIYHAAAHKHVPLMETSPCEAIKNNTIGTFKVAYAAVKYGVKRFVLISTDKAVNPTNVMGATKRTCEMVIQTFDKLVKNNSTEKLSVVEDCFSEISSANLKNKTEFVAVRFGNVLGSNGSVIPLFKKQIENGGPVTVTHPDIIRYFMTIPEAVSLVLQAGVYAKGGEIFVFDMGEPVKIDTLARNLIKLSGYKPDEDIKIVYTGLRPGEKLYEEKLMAAEGNKKTSNELIFVGQPLEINEDVFLKQIKELYETSYNNDEENTLRLIEEVVTTYKRKKA